LSIIDNNTMSGVQLPMPIFQLDEQIVFPSPELAEPNGLLAVGGDLSVERLVVAYRLGIFPWYSENDPILWWFTSPRFVLYPQELIIPKRLRRQMKNESFTVTFDHAFSKVIRACAYLRRSNDEQTWITDEMINSYTKLHKLGYAHSVECWQDNELAGGLYGVVLDRVFFGESMFTKISDSSKICFVHLVQRLKKHNFRLMDCQITTRHLLQFGAKEISGKMFRMELKNSITNLSADGAWKNDISVSHNNS